MCGVGGGDFPWRWGIKHLIKSITLGVCPTFAREGGVEQTMDRCISYMYLSTATSFPGSYLTMSALDCLEAMAGISIYNQLAPKYLTMAADLHLDHSTLNDLTAENNPVEGTKTMFKAWLSGESSVAPTWKMLLEKLDSIQMGELAQEITRFFNKTPVTSPSASLVSTVYTNILQLQAYRLKFLS